MQKPELEAALAVLSAATLAAGEEALRHFQPGGPTTARVRHKEGGSPVSDADHAANDILRAKLQAAFPDYGWLSEESEDDGARLSHSHVLIVDPIDGTRAFIAGESNWTVCAALAVDGRPVAGVVHAPALRLTLSAAIGLGAFANGRRLSATTAASEPYRITGPRPMIDKLSLELGPVIRLPRVASLAFRLAGIALGEADLALASANAHDWDIAAPDVILSEVGAALTDFHNRKPVYNRPDPVHPALMAATDPVRHRLTQS